jgi:LCP family protein required for cell wall assembly
MLITFLLLPACSIFSRSASVNTPIPVSDLLVGGNDRYTATPTPFQPAVAVVNPFATATSLPALPPTPATDGKISLGLERPDGQVNILLLGSDWRPGQGYRTDVMMVLSLIPDQNRVTLLSFPRDLYVNISGIGFERINAAQAYGGFELLAETLKINFDAPVDYYMMTNFAGFRSIIDTLGGINVNAAYELYDRCDLPQAYNKMCYIPAGWNTMNGDTALWYVRSRYSTSDFDRTRRAQEVMIAIAQKMMSLNAASRASELYELFRSSVETDIPLELVIQLLPLAAQTIENPAAIQRYAISENQISHYVVPESGAMVLLPDYGSIARTIKDALYPSLEQ